MAAFILQRREPQGRRTTFEDLRFERSIRSGMSGQSVFQHRSRHGCVPRLQRPIPNILPRSSARRCRIRDAPDLVARRQSPSVRAPSTSTAPPSFATTFRAPAVESNPANENKMIPFAADMRNWASMSICANLCCGRHGAVQEPRPLPLKPPRLAGRQRSSTR